MSSVFRIRTFTAGEAAEVIALWRRCDLIAPQNDPEKDIARKLRQNPEGFLVGECDGRLVATCMAGYEGHRGWINYLAVDPDFQRRGFGRRLMEEAERLLRAAGCPKINLQVRASNPDVVAFYERIGFRRDEVVSLGKRLEEDR